jgi:hypothetical protein
MWTLVADLFEFVIWPPLAKLSRWFPRHLERKQKWWHP